MANDNALVELGRRLAEYRRRSDISAYGVRVTGTRRTAGLRRDEVAVRTGLSYELISKIERGKYTSVNRRLLHHLSDFYRLDDAKRRDLLNLANLEERPNEVILERCVPPTLQVFVDAQDAAPTFVINRLWDVIGWNAAYTLVFGDLTSVPQPMRNILYLLFAFDGTKELVIDWERHARRVLGQFRLDYGWAHGDGRFQKVVDDLSEVSPHFREWWQGPVEVQSKQMIVKQVNHPTLGTLDYVQLGFRFEDNPNLLVAVHTPTSTRTLAVVRDALQGI